jgi:predicted transporter
MPDHVTDESQDSALLVAFYTQLFALAGAMVGVCLTVIGVLRLLTEVKGYRTLGDDLVAVDGLLFVFACMAAFARLKTRSVRRRQLWQQLTDTFFILAISLMAAMCALITWAFTHLQGGQ